MATQLARLSLTAALAVSTSALAQPGNTRPITASAPAPRAKQSAHTAELVAAFDRISAVRGQLADKATKADQIHLAILFDADHKVSGEERPALVAHSQIVEENGPSAANLLAFHAELDDGTSLWLSLELRGIIERGQQVHPLTKDAPQPVSQQTVRVRLAGDPQAPSSQPGRLRVAWLWGLLGENVNVGKHAAEFDAIVLGTQLVKTRVPANFEQPGKGSWLLLKTLRPDELYLAIDLDGDRLELFPKNPQQATEAGRAVFRAL